MNNNIYVDSDSRGAPRLVRVASLVLAGALAFTAQAQSSSPASPSPGYNTPSSPSNSENSSSSSSNMMSRTSGEKLTHAEKRFFSKASESGSREVELSRLATERSNNPEIKQFAEEMINDHEKLNNELSSLANTRGAPLKTAQESEHSYKKLSNETGPDFDKAYMKMMVSDHEDAVELFESAAKRNDDPEIQRFANEHLPELQQHLERAKQLRDSLK